MNKEIKISIKNRWTGSILFEYSSVDNTLAKTVTEALKGGADLCGANLSGANLRYADLRYADCNRCRIGAYQPEPVARSCGTSDIGPFDQDGPVADTYGQRCHEFQSPGQPSQTQERIAQNGNEWNAPNPDNGRLSKRDAEQIWNKAYPATERHGSIPNWDDFPTQSPVCDRNDGFPGELADLSFPAWCRESIKACGNAIVPQVALQIFETINKYENHANRFG